MESNSIRLSDITYFYSRHRHVTAVCGEQEYTFYGMKAQTKGEFGDYAELTGTDEQELKDAYEESLDDVMSIFEEVELFKVDFGDSVKVQTIHC